MKERAEILQNIAEAQKDGARLSAACRAVGLSVRTVQRWRREPGADRRESNTFTTCNALTPVEAEQVIEVACSPEFRDMSPNQIVPILAERGQYIASESTFFRLLKKSGLLTHRSRAKAPARKKPEEITATGPNQVWTWDISYFLTTVRGQYFYLYLILDIWDRTIVGWAVHEEESGELAAALIHETCIRQKVRPGEITVHQDNGGPMISFDFLAALSPWGRPSYSRPGVCDDNPYSESQFRTLKYRPDFPERFDTVTDAIAWMRTYVRWYHNVHRHSAIRFVTPLQRRTGKDVEILRTRHETYTKARARHPERWARSRTRNWDRPLAVTLNPRKRKNSGQEKAA